MKIASYTFGHLKMLVRFEADYSDNESSEKNDLSALLSGIDLKTSDSSVKIENSKLSYDSRGITQASQKSIYFTTFGADEDKFPSHKWELLFFTQVDYMLVGWHRQGMLHKVEKLSYDEVTARSNRTKTTIHEAMSKVADILTKLRDFALSQDREENARFSAIFTGDHDCINVYKCKRKELIPSKLAKKLYCEKKLKKDEVFDDIFDHYF